MSKEYSFSVMPSVSISRSRFARKSQHKTSFNLGQLIPIYCDEVLPGDTRSVDMAALVRMSQPIAPIMDNIYMDYYAFFVPNRIVWDHWKEFMGENNTSAGIPVSTYSVPYLEDNDGIDFAVGSYGDYLGIPTGVVDICKTNKISALPFRGVAKIYNRWFRNENLIAPLAVQTGDTNEVIVGELADSDFSVFATNDLSVLKASKLPDYFTKALPYAQKGAAVSIPIAANAPIIAKSGAEHTIASKSTFPGMLQSSGINGRLVVSQGDLGFETSTGSVTAATIGSGDVFSSNLVADLSVATATTINELRYAFQLQKFLEKDALYGSRYWEILAAHFGINAPDATLQEPEYLGGFRQRINVDQVLSTAGYDDTSSQEVGKPGANSVTAAKSSLFTKSFVEHGFLFIFAVARHDQTYTSGINRMWTRQGRYDYYWPVFANLGAQAILNKEIYAQGTSTDDGVFGYQEAWAEYRYKPSIATGLLNPKASGSLDYWTLANKFNAKPSLGQAFIEQGRDNIQRALATGSTGPDFICDFYFQDIAVRPMPMYSIPGLIDHH